ncbi:olfactory receptor 1468-like [Leptodactylus fuscus]
MYFFLTQLSFSDILLSTTIVPNMLHLVLHEGSSMFFISCLCQYYFFAVSEILGTLLLTVMSYDRYQAICHPLHYSMVMNPTFCLRVLVLFGVIVFVVILVMSVTMSYLWFCGPNIIDHFFCDLGPILELSCSDISAVKAESIFFMIPLAVCPFIVIIVSYVYIILTILKIPSVTGRQKTFSTCSSHLTVVSLYFGSAITIYLFPNIYLVPNKVSAKKILSLFYTIVTPLLNPLIYSLNSRDITRALIHLLSKVSTVLQVVWPPSMGTKQK